MSHLAQSRRLNGLALAALLATLVACGSRGPGAINPSLLDALPSIQSAVSTGTGYPATELEVLGNAARLRLAVTDEKLAAMDSPDRIKVATELVAAMERAMEGRPAFATIQEIHVAIVHPVAADAGEETHTEVVLAFRRTPSQHFAFHVS